MKNLIRKIEPVLKKEYYIREMVLLVIISLSLLCFGLYESLALFQTNIEKSNVATIIAGDIHFNLTSTNSKYNSSTGQITVAPGTTEELPLTITNNTPISAKYKLYYKSITPETIPEGVSIKVSSESEENFDEGILATNESVTRDISIENNSTSSVTLQFGVEKGYAHNELVLSEGKNNQLGFELLENNNLIAITNFEPLMRDEVLTSSEKKTFTIKNSEVEKKYKHISLDIETLSEDLRRYDIVWSLYEVIDTENNIEKNVSNGTFASSYNNISIGEYQIFETGEEKTYNLYIWLDKTQVNQSSLLNIDFNSNIIITEEPYYTSPESDFTVTEDGVLTSYNGTDSTVIIPSIVNGITVTEIGTSDDDYDGINPEISTVVIPNTVTTIGANAFKNSSSISKVILPNSITSIGEYAFEYAMSLNYISMPSSITTISDYAFYSVGLSSIFIPNNVVSIGKEAFKASSLSGSIVIPSSVTNIGSSAFELVYDFNITVQGRSSAPSGFGWNWDVLEWSWNEEVAADEPILHNVVYVP